MSSWARIYIAPRSHTYYPLKSIFNVPVSQIPLFYSKTLLRQWSKTTKNHFFPYLYVILRNSKHKIKILIAQVSLQYCFAHPIQISNRPEKIIEGAHWIPTNIRTDGRRTALHRISSVDNVSSGAKSEAEQTGSLQVCKMSLFATSISYTVSSYPNQTQRLLYPQWIFRLIRVTFETWFYPWYSL